MCKCTEYSLDGHFLTLQCGTRFTTTLAIWHPWGMVTLCSVQLAHLHVAALHQNIMYTFDLYSYLKGQLRVYLCKNCQEEGQILFNIKFLCSQILYFMEKPLSHALKQFSLWKQTCHFREKLYFSHDIVISSVCYCPIL